MHVFLSNLSDVGTISNFSADLTPCVRYSKELKKIILKILVFRTGSVGLDPKSCVRLCADVRACAIVRATLFFFFFFSLGVRKSQEEAKSAGIDVADAENSKDMPLVSAGKTLNPRTGRW